jgi:hypothetical protein
MFSPCLTHIIINNNQSIKRSAKWFYIFLTVYGGIRYHKKNILDTLICCKYDFIICHLVCTTTKPFPANSISVKRLVHVYDVLKVSLNMKAKMVWFGRFMVLNATFNNISFTSLRSVLLVEETGVPGENHWPVASHWQTLSHNAVSRTPRHERDLNSKHSWW